MFPVGGVRSNGNSFWVTPHRIGFTPLYINPQKEGKGATIQLVRVPRTPKVGTVKGYRYET